MNYYISRGGQQYGPYSLSDLQRYVQQGNIALSDQARSDGMTDWVPVSQIIGNINVAPAAPYAQPQVPQTPYNAQAATPYAAPASPYSSPATPANTPATPYSAPNPYGAPATPTPNAGQPVQGQYAAPANPYGAPASPAPYGAPGVPYGGAPAYGGVPQQVPGGYGYPQPPTLHWAIVLVITLFCGFFAWIWMFMQAAWVKKVRPQSNAMMLYILSISSLFGGAIVGVILMVAGQNNQPIAGLGALVMGVGELAFLVLFIMAIFSMRSAIEDFYNREEPVGLRLSGVMTFFFSVYYFQYHFTRINEMKQMAAMQQRGAAAGGGQYYGQ